MIINELKSSIVFFASICLIMPRLAFKLQKPGTETKIQIKVCTFAS